MVVGASIGIACYQTLIRRVTKGLHSVVLLQVTMMLGTALMLPAYLVQTLAGSPAGGGDCIGAWHHRVLCGVPIDLRGLPDQCGHRGVGTGADGIFNYLPPMFVAVIVIPMLGEELHRYHLVAFAIVIIGNAVSVRGRKLPRHRPEIFKGNSYKNS